MLPVLETGEKRVRVSPPRLWFWKGRINCPETYDSESRGWSYDNIQSSAAIPMESVNRWLITIRSIYQREGNMVCCLFRIQEKVSSSLTTLTLTVNAQ